MRFLRTTGLPFAFGIALGASTAAQAQALPNIGDAVRQAQPPAAPATQAPPLPRLSGVPAEPTSPSRTGADATVRVTSFSIVGNQAIDSASLLALLQPEQGQDLSVAQLDALAARITLHYRTHGYFVARAYIPAQELADGKLTIRVVEGQYGRMLVDNTSRVQDAVVQGVLEDIRRHGDVVSLEAVEGAMRVLNDTPGVRLKQATVQPGQQVGTTDLAVQTEAGPAFGGYVLLDNHGSTYTGKQRLSFAADWNSPSGRGDQLSVSGMATRDSGLLNGRVAYSAPIAADGTRAEAAISRTTYRLSDIYAPLEASGTAEGAELRLSKPLKRTRTDTVLVDLAFNYKRLRDEVGATGTVVTKRLASAQLGVAGRRDHVLWGLDGVSAASAAVTLGHLRFDDPTAAALDAAGARTQGSYAKLNFAASRVSALPAQLSLTVGLRAQAALGHKNLDGVERMSVSGAGAVGAYPIGEQSGDHAALGRIELARAFALSNGAQLGASVFADYGWTRIASAPTGVDASRTLGDVGVGLTARAGGAVLRLQLVRRTTGGAPISEPASKTRALLQLGWVL